MRRVAILMPWMVLVHRPPINGKSVCRALPNSGNVRILRRRTYTNPNSNQLTRHSNPNPGLQLLTLTNPNIRHSKERKRHEVLFLNSIMVRISCSQSKSGEINFIGRGTPLRNSTFPSFSQYFTLSHLDALAFSQWIFVLRPRLFGLLFVKNSKYPWRCGVLHSAPISFPMITTLLNSSKIGTMELISSSV